MFEAIFHDGCRCHLTIDELLQFGPSSIDYEEVWFTDWGKVTKQLYENSR
jgi:hypothetical protein